jgi:hypothetical protein
MSVVHVAHLHEYIGNNKMVLLFLLFDYEAILLDIEVYYTYRITVYKANLILCNFDHVMQMSVVHVAHLHEYIGNNKMVLLFLLFDYEAILLAIEVYYTYRITLYKANLRLCNFDHVMQMSVVHVVDGGPTILFPCRIK